VGDLYVVPAFSPPSKVSVQCRSVTYMSVRVEFRWSEELVARVDASRGDVSRASWVRRAVEQALVGPVGSTDLVAGDPPDEEPTPAEQPGPLGPSDLPGGVDYNRFVHVVQPRVRRDVKPFQRGGS